MIAPWCIKTAIEGAWSLAEQGLFLASEKRANAGSAAQKREKNRDTPLRDLEKTGRGRDGGVPPPPAQIRTGAAQDKDEGRMVAVTTGQTAYPEVF